MFGRRVQPKLVPQPVTTSLSSLGVDASFTLKPTTTQKHRYVPQEMNAPPAGFQSVIMKSNDEKTAMSQLLLHVHRKRDAAAGVSAYTIPGAAPSTGTAVVQKCDALK